MANEQQYEETDIITLTDEDGVETQFSVLATTKVDDTEYVALEPLDDNPDDQYVILKVATENGEEILVTIDDDDEFDRISDMFEDALWTEDYDENTPADEDTKKKKK